MVKTALHKLICSLSVRESGVQGQPLTQPWLHERDSVSKQNQTNYNLWFDPWRTDSTEGLGIQSSSTSLLSSVHSTEMTQEEMAANLILFSEPSSGIRCFSIITEGVEWSLSRTGASIRASVLCFNISMREEVCVLGAGACQTTEPHIED